MDSSKKLRQLANDFIVYKKSTGYVYDSQQYLLNRYVDYAEKVSPDIIYPEKCLTDKYLGSLSGAPGTLYGMISTLREFSNYLFIHGYENTYVIPPKTASQPVPEAPYFFAEDEISAFFEKLDEVEPHGSFKGREIVLPAIFRLIYCCGLRCKEARTLESGNVHSEALYIDVLQSKGPKCRRIFISQELAEYLNEYNARISLLFPDRKYYFPHGNSCYGSGMISGNFRRFWKKAYPDFNMTTRPRAYDFRHHLAWANLNRWAAEGLDINVMLAYLMRYMGHQNVSETLYYFRFVPEFFPTFREMSKSLEDILPEVPDEE
ncbi:tyrosine-type recombinase/integrase [Clostridium sp. C105KSO13]|uniref:tyrosine-type recombinase/integrase n=1 Tax=Clostridium sp. C105KSO13 TaxID=1776045 RepID=UPI0007408254|nr:tyrosine-type recombinase/integrase [Clostridium sp. C105KSO13]CUX32485.1 site-specific tyrosine recombinase XerC [Clostridium sp. C105KSO13]